MADDSTNPPKAPLSATKPPEHSKVNTVWVSIAFVVVILGLFVTFVAQNAQDVTVQFLWMSGTISLALALIIATLVGVVITFIVGSIRIWQLNRKNNQVKTKE